jgi:DNA-binding SARP family transcriptional activator
LAQAYLVALQELASCHLSAQAPKQAVEYIKKAIPLDPLNEELYCLAMRAYAEIKDRVNLARLYSDLQNLLLAELNAKPLPETVNLYQALQKKTCQE